MTTLVLLLISSFVHAADVCKSPNIAPYLKLDYKAFDQSPPDGGWRKLHNPNEIITVIDSYRKCKKGLKSEEVATLWFHSAQNAAVLEKYDDAIKRLEKSFDKKLDAEWYWNDFVTGNIAFLKHNLKGLTDARDHLAKLESDHPYIETLSRMIDCFDVRYKDVAQCALSKRQAGPNEKIVR